MHFIYLPNLPLLTYFKFSKHIRVFWRFFQKVKKSRNSQFLYKSGWAGLGCVNKIRTYDLRVMSADFRLLRNFVNLSFY